MEMRVHGFPEEIWNVYKEGFLKSDKKNLREYVIERLTNDADRIREELKTGHSKK